MTYEMSVVEVPEVRVIAIRGRHRPEDVPAFMQQSFADLFAHLGLLRVQPAGPPFALYHAFGPDGVDADVCVPVVEPVVATGRIETHVLPATICVRTLHVGPYEELSGAYAALSEWVDDHGYRPAGPVCEAYLNGPGDTTAPAEFRTVIDMPVMLVASDEPVLTAR